MKLPASSTISCAHHGCGLRSAFTLPEVLVAMTVFLLLVGGIVTANLFGLSMFRITETKLTATDDVRKILGRMTDEIRSCKTTYIGNVKNGEFAALLDGEKQVGSGLLIYPTTNTASYVIYFVNPTDKTFRRTTSSPGSASVVAESVTNSVVFRAQDYSGTVLTNNQNNRVISVNLEFFHPKSYLQVANYYKLETAVTRRALE